MDDQIRSWLGDRGDHLAEHPLDRPDGWPTAGRAMFHGPAGQLALNAARHTEADPVAVLAQLLAMFGAACGRGPHVKVGNARHPAAIWPVIVGPTAAGAKGTSAAVAKAAFSRVDDEFLATRVLGGFGSGEAIVDAVRDPGDDDDPAPTDRRLLVLEAEYARMLKVAGREGSTVSMTLRHGWDGARLEARSRARTAVASDYSMTVIGHVTPEELKARLSDTETYSGLSNRFFFLLSHRTQLLPEGGNVPDDLLDDAAIPLRSGLLTSQGRGEMTRTPAGVGRWRDIYLDLARDPAGGLLGAVVSRAAPQTLRIALTYALIDGASQIDVQHLDAAFDLWRYSRACAQVLFGDTVGDQVADKLLAAIRRAGPVGLDFTQQSDAMGRHASSARLKAARRLLEDLGLIITVEEPTAGRPRRVSRAKEAEEAN